MSDWLRFALWPPERITEALDQIAPPARAGYERPHEDPGGWSGPAQCAEEALRAAALRRGLEVDPVPATHAHVTELVRSGAPFVWRFEDALGPRYLVAVGVSSRGVELARPDRGRATLRPGSIAGVLRAGIETTRRGEVDALLDEARLSGRRREAARLRLLADRLGSQVCGTLWLLGRPPGASLGKRLVGDHVVSHLAWFLVFSLVAQASWIGSWWIIGWAAWHGRLDRSWFWAWLLLIATRVAAGMIAHWCQVVAGTRIGAAVRQRMLAGAHRLGLDAARSRGVGRWFGTVLESQWIESTALEAAFETILGLIEVSSAVFLLAVGAGGIVHAGLLLVWTLLTALLIARQTACCRDWTTSRLHLDADLVERLLGHRTRLAQEPPDRWHLEGDRLLAEYHASSCAVDRWSAWLSSIAARGWLIVGSLGLIPASVAGGDSAGRWAVSIAGVVLAFLSLRRVATAGVTASAVTVAWAQVGPLVRAGAASADRSFAPLDLEPPNGADRNNGRALLEAQGLTYGYRSGARPVLRDCNLTLGNGDRLLLRGSSGAGKSTLVALLSGLRTPDAGRVCGRGLDLDVLSQRDRRRFVAAAPQFHDNHVLSETLAFNLLMGRRWPPTPPDLVEARAICTELGLGPLLDAMPGGLFQQVGETGWQLSHGEQSRLYVARALLQGAPVVLLDESFGALDPESLRLCLDCVERRSRATLLVAHL